MRNTKNPIQLYRGTTQQHSDYAGPVGEITVDTEKYTVVVQNGVTGGVPLAREDTVVSLTNRIAAEESARATADTALRISITDEVSARKSADTALQNSITTEASARETADTALQNNIASEASARATADTAIQKSVTDEVSARQAADTALQKSITDEASARETADNAFQEQIDNTLRRGAVIGEIRWFAMSQPPTGWLVCNGAMVFTSNYAALFAAIGKTFTPQLTSTDPDVENPEYSDPAVFRLPNLIGKVPWGSTSVGTVLDAGAPDIQGVFVLHGAEQANIIQGANGAMTLGNIYNSYRTPAQLTERAGANSSGSFTFRASSYNSIYGNSDTVQPPALCLLPCIRYE